MNFFGCESGHSRKITLDQQFIDLLIEKIFVTGVLALKIIFNGKYRQT